MVASVPCMMATGGFLEKNLSQEIYSHSAHYDNLVCFLDLTFDNQGLSKNPKRNKICNKRCQLKLKSQLVVAKIIISVIELEFPLK
jgi:hypothetical protein